MFNKQVRSEDFNVRPLFISLAGLMQEDRASCQDTSANSRTALFSNTNSGGIFKSNKKSPFEVTGTTWRTFVIGLDNFSQPDKTSLYNMTFPRYENFLLYMQKKIRDM